MARTRSLHDAFVDELRDIYDAEKQLIKALPKLAKAATNRRLRQAFDTHLHKTRGHLYRLEHVFASLEEEARGRRCHAIAAIIEEHELVMEEDFDEETIDACLIAAGQRAEHYEMAAYRTLIAWAQTMGYRDEGRLLQQTLDEKMAADKQLARLAENGINEDAAYPD